jgi:hypothetical protein
MNETDNASERFDVLVAPDPEVLWTDPGLGKDGGCFSKH